MNNVDLSKKAIREFINTFCDEVYDMPFSQLELIMDNHRCFKWYGKEYFMPRDCSSYDNNDDYIYDHLYINYGL